MFTNLIVHTTPTEQLRAACKALNVGGKGGQKALAKLIGISPRTLRYKLTGKTGIYVSELEVAVGVLNGQHTTGGIQGG